MTAIVDLSAARQLRYFTKIIVGSEDECWPWVAGVDRKGYGNFTIDLGRSSKAHIYGYVLAHGPIPPGMHVDHECNNTGCQNPAHLRLLTPIANNARSTSPSAMNARKVACIRGHEFTSETTRIDGNGGRHCKICVADQKRAKVAA